jgi:hypothetical protein
VKWRAHVVTARSQSILQCPQVVGGRHVVQPCACHELPDVTAVQPVVALSKVRSAEEGGTAPLSFPFVRFSRIHIMSSQDTPGRPKSSASRQQTQPHQRAQSGSPELCLVR